MIRGLYLAFNYCDSKKIPKFLHNINCLTDYFIKYKKSNSQIPEKIATTEKKYYFFKSSIPLFENVN